MRLPQPFIRLALTVDVARLRSEIAQFGPGDWRDHPQGHPGNSALPLVARHGQAQDDGVAGPMAPTPHLARCPYVRQGLAALNAPIGRSRLMRLDAGAEATSHVDASYYWSQRVRVHFPIETTPGVRFLCGDAETHMAPGEVWIFDTWRQHNVLNPPETRRIHLVVDTVGSDAFWARTRDPGEAPSMVAYVPGKEPPMTMETINFPVVMSPYEFNAIWAGLRDDAAAANADSPSTEVIAAIDAEVRRVQLDWRAAWAAHGDAAEGWPRYAVLIRTLSALADQHMGTVRLANDVDLAHFIKTSLIPSLHSPQLARSGSSAGLVSDTGQPRSAKPSARALPESVLPLIC